MNWFNKVRKSEPVRVWVYPLLLAALGVAFKEGYLDGQTISMIDMGLMVLLGIGATEGVRNRVTPVKPTLHLPVNLPIPPGEGFESSGAHAHTEPLDIRKWLGRP